MDAPRGMWDLSFNTGPLHPCIGSVKSHWTAREVPEVEILDVLLLLLSHVQLFEILWTAAQQGSLSFTICWNSCALSRWCHPTISSSVVPFSSCLQSFPSSGPFLMSQLLASGGQSIRVSVSASVLPKNIQDWFPLVLTSLISLLSKGLSRVFSNTTVQKHQFFSNQLSV